MNNFIKAVMVNFFVLCLLLPAHIRAEDSESIFSGYTLTVGITAKQLDFDYYRLVDDLDPAGSMTEGMYATYLLRAGTPYVLSENKKWGYYFETGFSNFSMKKQNVGYDERDLGTSVDGNYWYVAPVGFYLFGPVPKNKNELSVIAGVGVGVGYLSAKGDMLLTEDGSNELLQVDVKGTDLAVSVLLEARYGAWMTRIYGGGPSLDKGESSYSIFAFSWDFGYVFTF